MSKRRQSLTDRQKQVYDTIVAHFKAYGDSPTVRDLYEPLGLKSPNSVIGHLLVLERKGWIIRETGRSRGIRLVGWKACPVCGK